MNSPKKQLVALHTIRNYFAELCRDNQYSMLEPEVKLFGQLYPGIYGRLVSGGYKSGRHTPTLNFVINNLCDDCCNIIVADPKTLSADQVQMRIELCELVKLLSPRRRK